MHRRHLKLPMPFATPLRSPLRALAVIAATAALLCASLAGSSSGDLQGQIAQHQSAVSSLQAAISAETAKIQATSSGIQQASNRLDSLQAELAQRITELGNVQAALVAARDHLVVLENRLQAATRALAANLVSRYEGSQPDLVSVVLESRGFNDLLENMNFLQRMAHADAQVVGTTRTARADVARQANALSALEARDRMLAEEVLGQRNQVAALRAALLKQRIAVAGQRDSNSAKMATLQHQLRSLEARAAAQAAAAAASGNAAVGGIAVNTGGMVQPPSGAPPAVAQVIAAGNAIATLPYVWGGGHGSFHASGYDCSGSVSYALAAAGLLSSPLDSTGFESWGLPGPGRWITVYANASHAWMEVAGWRFDTVALAGSGTRWSQGGGEFSGFVVRHPPGL